MMEFRKKMLLLGFSAFGILLFLLVLFLFLTQAPHNFPNEQYVVIEEGSTVKQVANKLKENQIIRSSILFTVTTIVFGKENSVSSGEYLFKEPESLFRIVNRIVTSDYGIDEIKITVHEGLTIAEIADLLSGKLSRFNKETFLSIALPFEGYLFPDTYNFLENADEEVVFNTMRKTFNEKTLELQSQLLEEGKSFDDIIIMASIIEKEADAYSRQEVSNILWKRMEIDMPLQVDAPFVYERQKGSFDLSLADLREDSDYNTYTRTGLTPTPISNPGLESIIAAAHPGETNYLFFLTGSDGQMYYATTHDGHVSNKSLYLR